MCYEHANNTLTCSASAFCQVEIKAFKLYYFSNPKLFTQFLTLLVYSLSTISSNPIRVKCF